MTLSKKDLKAINKLIDSALEEKVPLIVRKELKKELRKELRKELSYLPTKKEFYKKMDEIIGELKNMRETYELAAPKISNHEDRITSLEDIHPHDQHPTL